MDPLWSARSEVPTLSCIGLAVAATAAAVLLATKPAVLAMSVSDAAIYAATCPAAAMSVAAVVAA